MSSVIKTLKSKFWCLTMVSPLMVLPLIGCSRTLTKMEEEALKVWTTKEGNDKLYSWYLQKTYTKLNKQNNVKDEDFIKNILYLNDENSLKHSRKIKKFLKFILQQEIRNNENFLNELFAKLNNTIGGLNDSIIRILKEKILDFWITDDDGYPRNRLNVLLEKLGKKIDIKEKNKINRIVENIALEESTKKEWYKNSDIKNLVKNHIDTTYIDLLLWLIMSNPGNELNIKVWHMAIVDNFLTNVKEEEFKKFWIDDNKNKSYETYVDDLKKIDKNWLLNRHLLSQKLMLHWKLILENVKEKPETDEEVKIKDLLEEYEYKKEGYYNARQNKKFSIKQFIKKQFILNQDQDKESLISFINHKYEKYKYSNINKNDFWTYKDFGLTILDNFKIVDEEIDKCIKKKNMYGFAGIGEIPKSNDQWFDYSNKDITSKSKYQGLQLAGLLHKPHNRDNYNLISKNGNEWPVIKQKSDKDITGVVQYMVGLMPRYKTKDGKTKLTLEGTFLEGKEDELKMILGTREKVIKEALDYYEYREKTSLDVPSILFKEVNWVSLWTKDRMKKDKNYKELAGNSEKPYEQGFLSHDWSYISNKELEDLLKEKTPN